MAENEMYQCRACGQVFEAFEGMERRCPNCGGVDVYQRDAQMLESERLATETDAEGVHERNDSAVRQDVARGMDDDRFGQGKIA